MSKLTDFDQYEVLSKAVEFSLRNAHVPIESIEKASLWLDYQYSVNQLSKSRMPIVREYGWMRSNMPESVHDTWDALNKAIDDSVAKRDELRNWQPIAHAIMGWDAPSDASPRDNMLYAYA